MSVLQKIFPLSFKAKTVGQLVLWTIIYAVLPTAVAIVYGIVKHILIVGFLTGIVSSLAGLYCTAGIVILFLVYFKVIK